MDRKTVISTLKMHRQELKILGVKSLSLFGSVATGQATAGSDIDLAAKYDERIVRDLMDMGGIAAAIEDYLGTDNFDLANEENLSPHVRNSYMNEHVRIF